MKSTAIALGIFICLYVKAEELHPVQQQWREVNTHAVEIPFNQLPDGTFPPMDNDPSSQSPNQVPQGSINAQPPLPIQGGFTIA